MVFGIFQTQKNYQDYENFPISCFDRDLADAGGK